MKSWCGFKRCNVHTAHTNLLLLIYMSVMHVQNQNSEKSEHFNHNICIYNDGFNLSQELKSKC